MEITPGSRRDTCLKRLGIFLFTVALLLGMAACTTPAILYDLTISSTEGGEVTTPGEGTFTYSAGRVVTMAAMADEGYEFAHWTGATVSDPGSATTTVTMDAAKTVAASFAPLRCSLTAGSTTGGSVTTPGEGAFTYDRGTVVDLVATPDAGYRFVNWKGDVDTIANLDAASTTITMDTAKSVTASFALLTYNLRVDSTTGGSVTTPGEGAFTYDRGTVVDLVATPDASCRFATWTGDVDTIEDVHSAETTITMSGNYSITASFSTTMIAAGAWHTVGLKSDGTLVAVGYNRYGQCSVGGWTGILEVGGGG